MRIQLVRQIRHGKSVIGAGRLRIPQLYGLLQLPAPNVAPRADRVGHDVDAKVGHGDRLGCMSVASADDEDGVISLQKNLIGMTGYNGLHGLIVCYRISISNARSRGRPREIRSTLACAGMVVCNTEPACPSAIYARQTNNNGNWRPLYS